MKELNFNFESVKGLSCYNACLLVAGALLDYEYQIAYANTYLFEYHHDNSDATIGEKLEVEDHTIPYFAGEELHLCFRRYEDNKNLLEHIDTEMLFGNPVIITINSFYCHWSEFYNKRKTLHNIIIFKKEKALYYCIDPQANQKYHQIKKSQLNEMLYESIYLWAGKKQGILDYHRIFINSRNKILSGNIIKNIQWFYNDIRQLTQDKLRIEYRNYLEHYVDCYIYYKLANVLPRYHLLYVAFLENINHYVSIFNYQLLCELIKKSANQWKLIQNKLLRFYLTDKLEICKIVEPIEQVITYEKNIHMFFEKTKANNLQTYSEL